MTCLIYKRFTRRRLRKTEGFHCGGHAGDPSFIPKSPVGKVQRSVLKLNQECSSVLYKCNVRRQGFSHCVLSENPNCGWAIQPASSPCANFWINKPHHCSGYGIRMHLGYYCSPPTHSTFSVIWDYNIHDKELVSDALEIGRAGTS